jgi:hypothetical protein
MLGIADFHFIFTNFVDYERYKNGMNIRLPPSDPQSKVAYINILSDIGFIRWGNKLKLSKPINTLLYYDTWSLFGCITKVFGSINHHNSLELNQRGTEGGIRIFVTLCNKCKSVIHTLKC